MRVAVTGATGLVGRFLVWRLLLHGHTVHALRRADRRPAGFFDAPNLFWFVGDLRDAQSLTNLIDGCDAVVHAAFDHVPGRFRGGEGDDPTRFKEINLYRTLAFFALLQQTTVSRTVFISSRAVFDSYGDSTEPIPDEAPTRPHSLYGEVKAQTETAGETMDGIGFCSLRPTGIYGLTWPVSQTKWFEFVKNSINQAQSTLTLSNQLRTEVHGDDVADAIELLLAAPLSRVEQKRFNCSDVAVSKAQLAAMVCRIASGKDFSSEALPTGNPPNYPMVCNGLTALGWRPGGMPKLLRTLSDLVAAAR